MKKEPKNHLGHFERVRKSVLTRSAYEISEVEIVEMLLQGVLRRADTNEIAHHLLKAYGNFKNLYTKATVEDLVKIPGLANASAEKLTALLKTYVYATLAPHDVVVNAGDSYEKVLNHIREQFRDSQTEKLIVFVLNKQKDIINITPIAEGDVEHIVVDINKILQVVKMHKGAGVVLAHNHLNNSLCPSIEDVEFTSATYKLLAQNRLELVDHLIITSYGHFSFETSNLLQGIKNRINNKVSKPSLRWYDD